MNARRVGFAVAAASAVLGIAAAFAGAPGAGVRAAATAAPARLRDTGLYLADGTVDPRNRPFAPQYPLWTDGATKRRWIRLPGGATIDVSDADAWRFPPGTILWKEFAWNGWKVETRMIRRETDGGWTFAAYAWNAEQTDAVLAPADGVPAAFEIPGAGGRRHSIPGLADCGSCHGSSPAVVLGFDALQLSDDRDPGAPHAEAPPSGALTLRALEEEGLLSPRRARWTRTPPRIRTDDPVERSALGYLSANCGTCHHARGPLARLGFSLRHDVGAASGAPEPALLTTRDARGRYAIPGVAGDSVRLVAPGDPRRSTILHRMKSRRAASQMPPPGTVVADSAAAALIERWIGGLAERRMADAGAGARD